MTSTLDHFPGRLPRYTAAHLVCLPTYIICRFTKGVLQVYLDSNLYSLGTKGGSPPLSAFGQKTHLRRCKYASVPTYYFM